MHELQIVFATEEGELGWTRKMRALFGAGAFDEAESLLAEGLSALDSELAWLCLELPRDGVVLSGWEEMDEAIALHEGDPVTAVTIAIANEADRAFEKGQLHHPYVLVGLYTDEAYPFSKTAQRELLEECHAGMPGWAGREEDVEIHMDIEGLDALNTSLIHHKQRHYFRENGAAPAPLRYVEFVLACWWRALRWHQAVAAECRLHGLTRAIPVVAGMVDMRPEAVAIHASGIGKHGFLGGDDDEAAERSPAGSTMAESFGAGFIQRKVAEEEKAPPTGSDIRRRALEDGEVLEKPARTGLWARIFGRR